MRAVLASSVLVAACSFKGGFDGTHYKCGAGDTCPTGQTCVAGECVAGPDTPDSPPGTPDAPLGTPDAPLGTPDGPIGGARCGTLGVLQDLFDNSGTLNTLWSAWSDGAPTVSISNSRLVITLPGGAQAGNGPWAGVASTFMYDFAGSELEATVSQVGGTDTLIEVRGANDEKAQMVVENGVLYAGVYGNVPNIGTRAQVTYDPAVHKVWRIRENAGITYWEWSTDGAAWTELWHEANPYVGDDVHHVWAEISAGGQQSATTEAHFDNVNKYVTPAVGLCGASTWQDDFLTSTFGLGWNYWNDNHTTLASTAGQAVITTDGSSNFWAGFQTWHLYDLRGQTYYADLSTVPKQGGFVTWMQAMAPGNGNTTLEFNEEGSTLYFIQTINGTDTDTQQATYDPVAMKYWRFRADAAGTNVYLDTSPDAATWTARLTAPARFDVSQVFFVHGAGEYQAVPAETQKTGSVNLP